MNIEVDANTIIKACQGKGLNEVPQHSLLNCCQRAPPNPPNQRLSEEQLLPCTPTICLSNKNEIFNPWVRQFCLRQPIVLIQNLVKFLDFDLSLFTTDTLVKVNPQGIIEERIQMAQNSEENWDEAYKQKVWNYFSFRHYSTIEDYALYQSKEYQKVKKKRKTPDNENNDNFDQSNLDLEEDQTMIEHKKEKIRFGTVDLSNMKKWNRQWKELRKLPSLFQIESDDNMLNYVDYNILGMNTIQLYMKVY